MVLARQRTRGPERHGYEVVIDDDHSKAPGAARTQPVLPLAHERSVALRMLSPAKAGLIPRGTDPSAMPPWTTLARMHDDWRLRVDLHEEGLAHELTSRLEAFDLAHEMRTSFGDRVIVSRDGPEVFCYTDSRPQAEAAENALRAVAGKHGWRLDCRLERWHPVAERWEEPDTPLPGTVTEAVAERSEMVDRERLESAEQGYPEYEVRVRCPSQAAALELATQLRIEGVQVVQRREFLLLGAPDQATAAALAERIRHQAPAGSDVTAEGSVAEVLAEAPFATPFSPFSVFGGLAG